MITSKKGFGDAASTLIMFIAVISVTTGLVLAFQAYIADTKQSMSVQRDVLNNQLKTVISITNVYYNDTSDRVYVYVKNIGETKLYTEDFDYFVDDEYQENFEVYSAGNLSLELKLLNIQQTAVFITNKTLNSGTHDVKMVSGYGGDGDSDSFNT